MGNVLNVGNSASEADPREVTAALDVLDSPHDTSISSEESAESSEESTASSDESTDSKNWEVLFPIEELEGLLTSALKDLDTNPEAFKRLSTLFIDILTRDEMSDWPLTIHDSVYENCKYLMELCALEMPDDCLFPLLEVLAVVFDPNCQFHILNDDAYSYFEPSVPYAHAGSSSGWLVNLIDRFGEMGGFEMLLDRFDSEQNLSVSELYTLLKPFGLAYECITKFVLQKYMLPIVMNVPTIIERFLQDVQNSKIKTETNIDLAHYIVKYSINLVSALDQEWLTCTLDDLRLEVIALGLKFSNETEGTRYISEILLYIDDHEDDEFLDNKETVAKKLDDKLVIGLIFRNWLHVPECAKQVDDILLFSLRTRILDLSMLDSCSPGSPAHQAAMKRVHDFLLKTASECDDDDVKELEDIFWCLQSKWLYLSHDQRVVLVALIRRLLEDDSEGVRSKMALFHFWDIARNEFISLEMLKQVLDEHLRILKNSYFEEDYHERLECIYDCVDLDAPVDRVVHTLKHLRELCCLYTGCERSVVIQRLEDRFQLVDWVIRSFKQYKKSMLQLIESEEHEGTSIKLFKDNQVDFRYSHELQVQVRLDFLTFIFDNSNVRLSKDQAFYAWRSVTCKPVISSDLQACLHWFTTLLDSESGLDPDTRDAIFSRRILRIDPVSLKDDGYECFELFFKAVNFEDGKLKEERLILEENDHDIIGLDYLWKLLGNPSEVVGLRAAKLLKEIESLLLELDLHSTIIDDCFSRLRAHYIPTVADSCDEEESKRITRNIVSIILNNFDQKQKI